MIDRFKWCTCCVLALILQFALSPLTTIAATEMPKTDSEPKSIAAQEADLPKPVVQIAPSLPAETETQPEGREPKTVPTTAPDLPDPASQNSLPLSTDSLQLALPPQQVTKRPQRSERFVISDEHNLTRLMGAAEISVFADINGQFVSSMAENQIFTEEFASQLDEIDLLDSIRSGRSFSRESRAAIARTRQAKAQSGQALGLLLPSVYIRYSRGQERSTPSVVVDQVSGELLPYSRHIRTDVTLTAVQPLVNLPSFLDWRRRKVKVQAREEAFRVSDGDAYTATVKTYLSLVASRLQADVTRAFEAQLAELLGYIEKRAGAGAASVSDMSRVRARSQATRSSRLEQESAHAAAGTEFVRLTNFVPQKVRLPQVEDVGASALPATFEMAVVKAMEVNPEIAALTAELQAERIDQMAAKSVFLPRIDAEYTDTYSLHAGGSSDSQRDKRIMLVANWNLLNGGKDYMYHDERAAKYKELQYRLDDQRRRVVQALSASYATLTTTGKRIVSGYEELASISTAAEAMSKRMLSGNQSLLDLLTVYDRRYQIRSRLVALHILEMNTVAQLIRLTQGTPWPAPEITIFADERHQETAFPVEDDWLENP